MVSKVYVYSPFVAAIGLLLMSMATAQNVTDVENTTLFDVPTVLKHLQVNGDYTTKKKDEELALKNVVDDDFSSPTTLTPHKTVKNVEKAIMDYVNNIMRQVLPYIMSSASSKLSMRCMTSMMKIFSGLRKLKGWTLKLLDSSGKISAGILSGRVYSLGDYDQCLSISVNSKGIETVLEDDEMFRGQYCLIRIKQEDVVIDAAHKFNRGESNGTELGRLKEMIEAFPYVRGIKDYMSHFVGICIPSSCDEDDVTAVASSLPFPGTATLEKCETRSRVKLDLEQKVVIGIFGVLITFVVISTILDIVLRLYSSSEESIAYKKYMRVLTSFSICLNTPKLLKRVKDDHTEVPDWRQVRGLYVITVLLIIIYHTSFMPLDTFQRQIGNIGNLELYMQRLHFTLVITLPIAMETLFFSYGFNLTNKIWKSSCGDKNVRCNFFKIIFSNYAKLCVPLLFCNGIIILLPLFGSGPFWADVSDSLYKCKGRWLPLLGMYDNTSDYEDQCLPHLWFVPCLMQLILIAAFLMLIMSRWLKFGVFLTMCAAIGCNITVGMKTYQEKLPPTFVEYFRQQKSDYQWKLQESLPLIHFTPFATGLLLGILTAKKSEVCMKKFATVSCWIIAVLLFGLCTMFIYQYNYNGFETTPSTAAYAPLQKTLYGLAVAWVTFTCAYSKNGLVKSILSWSVFDPLYKLSFLAYLLHLVLIVFHASIAREQFHYSDIEIILRAISYIVVSYFFAYISYMVVIMPFKSLASAVFSFKTKQLKVTNSMTNNPPGQDGKLNNIIKPKNLDDSGYFNKFSA